MQFVRHFTKNLLDHTFSIQESIKWKTTDAIITDKDDKIIFEMKHITVPSHWSQTATNIIAQKYFRKAGVPKGELKPKEEAQVPLWLCPRQPNPNTPTSHEYSAHQVFHRLAGCWTYWGWKEQLITDETNARIFYDEIYFMLAMQMAAPNSPQWFNTGLHWAYGIAGPDSGQWTIDKHSRIVPIENSYERPQPHACFIQPITDDLVNPGGIMDLWTREARLFKHGSGTGTNFSKIREKGGALSGGGKSSGLMSFLKIGDAAAGAIQSGGVTRRAAKMVCLDMDHPEIEDFIDWKMREERKARSMKIGSEILHETDNGDIYDDSFEGEAISTVSGQNSNNSVRITDEFLQCVLNDDPWSLTSRTTGETIKIIQAKDLWKKICYAAHQCADPGVQFHDTINKWHTCKTDGDINASNPCSEYMFCDNTACNLASLNLCTFWSGDRAFDIVSFQHAVRIWTVVLEISVYMASFPSKEIAEGSYNYRTLGLGYANLGALIFKSGLKYDSDDGRNLAADITALMHFQSYKTSAEMANELGPFPCWEQNRKSMENVLFQHAEALIDPEQSPIRFAAFELWKDLKDIICHPTFKGFRNAQTTLLAPTGTIALLMDCSTTGIEPFFAQKTFKNLSGGGQMEFENTTIPVSECAIGDGCLRPMAHVLMVAAVQPFLSGAVSKTVNMPNHATVDDVSEVYLESHRLGLKAIAIYRDGSKMTQPLNIKKEDKKPEPINDILSRPFYQRFPLPNRRTGYTQKVRIDNQVLYHRTGNHPDGSLGEIFETLNKEGSTIRALMECFSKAISISLQYGVPLEEFVEAFINTKFEPSGIVQGHDQIKLCSSIMDFIFRDLAINYLKRDELGNVKPKSQKEIDETEVRSDNLQELYNKLNGTSKSDQDWLQNQIASATHDISQWPDWMKNIVTDDRPTLPPPGDLCPSCGHLSLVRVGTCTICTLCYANTGCG